jgi:hypothetical protein
MVFLLAATIAAALTGVAAAEAPARLRHAAAAYMLSDDNPLKEGLPYDGAIEIELPGYRYDPPRDVPAAPGEGPLPDRTQAEQVLAGLRGALGLEGPVLLHGVTFHGDLVLALVVLEADRQEAWRTFALEELPGEGWRHNKAARALPVVEVVAEGWRESHWIEVVPDGGE